MPFPIPVTVPNANQANYILKHQIEGITTFADFTNADRQLRTDFCGRHIRTTDADDTCGRQMRTTNADRHMRTTDADRLLRTEFLGYV